MFLNNDVNCWWCISNRWLLFLENNSEEPKKLLCSAFHHPRDLWPFSFLVQTGTKVICPRAAFPVAPRAELAFEATLGSWEGFPSSLLQGLDRRCMRPGDTESLYYSRSSQSWWELSQLQHFLFWAGMGAGVLGCEKGWTGNDPSVKV